MSINDYKKYEPFWGKWYLSKELGRGAFGTVFEAETQDFGNMKAALKIISIPSSASEVDSYREEHFGVDEKSVTSYFYGFVEEFLREISIMSQLKGKSNIVSIEDYEVKERTDNVGWDIFIRMELLTSFNKYFAGKTITEKDVIKLGVDICRALEGCASQNIIHRDIKPSNIFVSDSGDFKLGDFGVARTLEKTSSALSKKGTYTYMAPEIYRGYEEYDSSVDIYSLGIVMYKLLNNHFEPFRTQLTASDEENALRKRLKNEPMPNPANASDGLSEIILKACKYNPDDRYKSPMQMRLELENLLSTDSVSDNAVSYNSQNDDEEDKTVGLFSSVHEIQVESDDDIEELAESADDTENSQNEINANNDLNDNNSVAINSELVRIALIKNTTTPKSINFYLDGKLFAEKIKDLCSSFLIPSGAHQVRIVDASHEERAADIVVDSTSVLIYNQNKDKSLDIINIDWNKDENKQEIEQNKPKMILRKIPMCCPKCESSSGWGKVTVKKKFNVGLSLIGGVLTSSAAFPVGIAMGLVGNKRDLYYCSECGYHKEYMHKKEKDNKK